MEKLTPRPELLVGKSNEVSQAAGQSARELLARHPNLVAPGVVDLIAQTEAELAAQDYVKRRNEGNANDDYSLKPGLIVYLTPQGCQKVVETCEKAGYAIVPTQFERVNLNLVALQLPRGIYGMGGGGAKFYQETSANWEKYNMGEKPFSLEYDEVVRIEGSADELWQNADYHWDGTPKATS